jgi:glycosyltransferase involved in cell wall biosynthesis
MMIAKTFDAIRSPMPQARAAFDRQAPTCMCPPGSNSIDPTPASPGRIEPIRLMFLTDGFVGSEVSRVAVDLITHLNATRFVISICSLRELGPEGKALARTFPAMSHVLHHRLDLPAIMRLAKQLKGRVDAVLTVGSGEPMSWGCAAARWARIPVVLSLLDARDRPAKLSLGNRLVAHWSDGLITDREQQRQLLITRQRFAPTAIHTIPQGIDTQRFSFQPSGAFAVRKQFKIPTGAPLCGLSIVNESDATLQQVFDVVRRVRFQQASAQFVLLPPSSPQLRLRQRLQQAGLASCVHVIEESDDLPRVLSAMSVLGVVGHSALQDRCVSQAMAVQVPVVAMRVSEWSALDHADGTGYLIAVEDANALTGRMMQLIGDSRWARGLGERARHYVRKHRSLEVMVRRYERLIVETYHRKRSGPGAPLPASLRDAVEFCGAAP